MARIKREQLEEHLVEKQFNYLDLTILDALFTPDWKEKWTLTQKQHDDWEKYCMSTLKKVLKINKSKAAYNFKYLKKNFGLKIK